MDPAPEMPSSNVPLTLSYKTRSTLIVRNRYSPSCYHPELSVPVTPFLLTIIKNSSSL